MLFSDKYAICKSNIPQFYQRANTGNYKALSLNNQWILTNYLLIWAVILSGTREIFEKYGLGRWLTGKGLKAQH